MGRKKKPASVKASSSQETAPPTEDEWEDSDAPEAPEESDAEVKKETAPIPAKGKASLVEMPGKLRKFL